jgi:tRNA isopentenyl-2-thiomethyl-A-37 hydroxylase MiaE
MTPIRWVQRLKFSLKFRRTNCVHAHFQGTTKTPLPVSILAGCDYRALTSHYSESMSSTQPAAGPTSSQSTISVDHPGVDELFALLAYGEVAAFYRLTEEARMAPNLAGRINMASMAAAEMQHYEMLRDSLERRGVDIVPAMAGYASTLDDYHRLTTPSTWLEALVKAFVGDALAADFYMEIAGILPEDVAGVVRAVLSETGHSQFVVAEVRAAIAASDRQRSRLALWSRRLLGEAITQAQYVLADHDELVDLVMSGPGGLGQMTEFFDRLQRTHAERMQELGLA